MPRPQNLPTSFFVFATMLALLVVIVVLIDRPPRPRGVEPVRAATDEVGLREAMSFTAPSRAQP